MAQLPFPEVDRHWLLEAIELSRHCPPSATAFSVGAVLVGPDGTVLGYGYSREFDPADHAEEVALARAARAGAGPGLLAVRRPHRRQWHPPGGDRVAGTADFRARWRCRADAQGRSSGSGGTGTGRGREGGQRASAGGLSGTGSPPA
jgi:hypothetical protein